MLNNDAITSTLTDVRCCYYFKKTKTKPFNTDLARMKIKFGEDAGDEKWKRWVKPLISSAFSPNMDKLTWEAYTLQLAELVLLADTSENGKELATMNDLICR